MKRRAFISLLGGAAVSWPLAAHAQEATSTIRRVGFLLPGVARTTAVRGLLEAFREGLKEYGWVEGQHQLRVPFCRGQRGHASGDRRRVGSIAAGCHRG
jgi:hypothetical protein